MLKKNQIPAVLDALEKEYPDAECALDHQNIYQLLIAVVLSAQTTDVSVNKVTPALFEAYPTPEALSNARNEDVEVMLKTIGMYRTKARNIINLTKQLCEKYGGSVPHDYDALVSLSGVGRKTANVLQAVWFGKPTLAVDTHVYRVSHRLGLVPNEANTPRKVEDYLMKNIPLNEVSSAHHWILLHGRYICKSMRPLCEKCPFDTFCPKNLENSKLSNK